MTEKDIVWIGDNAAFLDKVKAVMITDTPTVFDEKNLNIIEGDDFRVAPWGLRNLLPQMVMDKIERV